MPLRPMRARGGASRASRLRRRCRVNSTCSSAPSVLARPGACTCANETRPTRSCFVMPAPSTSTTSPRIGGADHREAEGERPQALMSVDERPIAAPDARDHVSQLDQVRRLVERRRRHHRRTAGTRRRLERDRRCGAAVVHEHPAVAAELVAGAEAGVLGPARFDLHDRPVVVPDRRERVLESAAPGEAPRVHARRLAEPPAHGVEVVEHQVQDDAAALRGVEVPLARRSDREVAAHEGRDRRAAERAVVEQLLRALVLLEVAHDVSDRERHAGLVARAHHRLAVRERPRERLLAEHVLARLRGGDRVLRVKVRRRRDDDQVDVVGGADLLRAGEARAALFRERRALLERESGDRDDLHAIDAHARCARASLPRNPRRGRRPAVARSEASAIRRGRSFRSALSACLTARDYWIEPIVPLMSSVMAKLSASGFL